MYGRVKKFRTVGEKIIKNVKIFPIIPSIGGVSQVCPTNTRIPKNSKDIMPSKIFFHPGLTMKQIPYLLDSEEVVVDLI
jgi:hypothetical protein